MGNAPQAITVINDCKDENAVARQQSRLLSMFGAPITFVGVSFTLEAAGNLVDVLDAVDNRKAAVLVNVAPRNGEAKKWQNGSPFAYFRYKNTLVVTTITGYTLSLIKKLGLIKKINVIDTVKAVDTFIKVGAIPKSRREDIINTQFRSYEFLPFALHYLINHKTLLSTQHSLDDIPEAPKAVWWVDNFGNGKTTLLPKDIEFASRFTAGNQNLPVYPRLKDVPDNKCAVVVGSSGIAQNRFLEIVKQGGSAASQLNLHSGSIV